MTLHELVGLACAVVIWVWSPLFARARALFPQLLACAMCVGFWVGLAGSVACGRPDPLSAAIVSVLSFAIVTGLRRLEMPDAAAKTSSDKGSKWSPSGPGIPGSPPRIVALHSAKGAPGSRAVGGAESCCGGGTAG